MRYLQTYETRYTKDSIDKKYYVWKRSEYSGDRLGVLFIDSVDKEFIYYKMIDSVRWRGNSDFFHQKNYDDFYARFYYKVSIRLWRREMSTGLLFSTNDKEDAKDFLNLRKDDKAVNAENFEMYRDAKKYNL